jgi:hypothetical protein
VWCHYPDDHSNRSFIARVNLTPLFMLCLVWHFALLYTAWSSESSPHIVSGPSTWWLTDLWEAPRQLHHIRSQIFLLFWASKTGPAVQFSECFEIFICVKRVHFHHVLTCSQAAGEGMAKREWSSKLRVDES